MAGSLAKLRPFPKAKRGGRSSNGGLLSPWSRVVLTHLSRQKPGSYSHPAGRTEKNYKFLVMWPGVVNYQVHPQNVRYHLTWRQRQTLFAARYLRQDQSPHHEACQLPDCIADEVIRRQETTDLILLNAMHYAMDPGYHSEDVLECLRYEEVRHVARGSDAGSWTSKADARSGRTASRDGKVDHLPGVDWDDFCRWKTRHDFSRSRDFGQPSHSFPDARF